MSTRTAIVKLKDQIETRAERGRDALTAARRRHRAVDATVDVYERDRRAAGTVLAGAVAFRLFVYLLPLALGVLTLAGFAVSVDENSAEQIGEDLGLSSYVIGSVETAADQSHRSLWVLAPLALWATYWAGVGTSKTIRAVHALAWEQPVHHLRRGMAAAAVTFGLAVGVLALVGGSQTLRHLNPDMGVGLTLLGVIPFTALWFGASLLLPRDPRARWTALLPGSLLVGTYIWAVHLTSSFMLARRLQHSSELYGSLGGAAAILAALYLAGRVMVASAMLNATLWFRHAERGSDRVDGADTDAEADLADLE